MLKNRIISTLFAASLMLSFSVQQTRADIDWQRAGLTATLAVAIPTLFKMGYDTITVNSKKLNKDTNGSIENIGYGWMTICGYVVCLASTAAYIAGCHASIPATV